MIFCDKILAFTPLLIQSAKICSGLSRTGFNTRRNAQEWSTKRHSCHM